MTKRKKRLKKGMHSLEKQILLHLDKQKSAAQSGKIELVDYYAREIAAKKIDLERKKRKVE